MSEVHYFHQAEHNRETDGYDGEDQPDGNSIENLRDKKCSHDLLPDSQVLLLGLWVSFQFFTGALIDNPSFFHDISRLGHG